MFSGKWESALAGAAIWIAQRNPICPEPMHGMPRQKVAATRPPSHRTRDPTNLRTRALRDNSRRCGAQKQVVIPTWVSDTLATIDPSRFRLATSLASRNLLKRGSSWDYPSNIYWQIHQFSQKRFSVSDEFAWIGV